MIVHLTQEDIDEQTQCDRRDCGLARAIRRATGKPFTVGLGGAYLGCRSYRLPPEAIAARGKLDRGERIAPMSFAFQDEPV